MKYTLRLETDGKEVWKRWTGDREEVIRLAIPALVDLGAAERVAQMFLYGIPAALAKDGFAEVSAYSADLRSTLTLITKG